MANWVLMKRYDRQRKWRRAAKDMKDDERRHCELAELEVEALGPGASDQARIILERLEEVGVLGPAARLGQHHRLPKALVEASLARASAKPDADRPYELPDCLKPGWDERKKHSMPCPTCGAPGRVITAGPAAGLHYCPNCTPRPSTGVAAG